MDRRVELALTEIENDLAHAWDLAQLAALVNLSPSRFRHLFKEETGYSLSAFLLERRLEHAELLLRTTFLSIKEVRVRSGLNSATRFGQYFKRRYGSSPSAYRKHFSHFG